MPWSIMTLSAPVIFQVKFADSIVVISKGFMSKETITGGLIEDGGVVDDGSAPDAGGLSDGCRPGVIVIQLTVRQINIISDTTVKVEYSLRLDIVIYCLIRVYFDLYPDYTPVLC